MLILRILQRGFQSKKSFQAAAGACALCLSVSLLYLLSQIRPVAIPCHSDQLIKQAEYTLHPDAPPVSPTAEFRDVEYDESNTILLAGAPEAAHTIAQIHGMARSMENRTKGYDISIGTLSWLEMAKYFFVLEIEDTPSETVLYVKNRGWQANSDVFSIFCERLPVSNAKNRDPFHLVSTGFSRIFLGVHSEEIEPLLGILHNIHNLYSHSLGVYFYWVFGEKAVFLCSNVLLVLVTALFLLFLEFITCGDFTVELARWENIPFLVALGHSSVLVDTASFSFFETFLLYCVLAILQFPLALLLGVSRILFFFCGIIGCRERREVFLAQFDLLYERTRPDGSGSQLLPDSVLCTDRKKESHLWQAQEGS